MVPKIAKAPRRVPSPQITIQLPTTSANAAKYEEMIGNGRCNGLTNASAKFSIFSSFSYP